MGILFSCVSSDEAHNDTRCDKPVENPLTLDINFETLDVIQPPSSYEFVLSADSYNFGKNDFYDIKSPSYNMARVSSNDVNDHDDTLKVDRQLDEFKPHTYTLASVKDSYLIKSFFSPRRKATPIIV